MSLLENIDPERLLPNTVHPGPECGLCHEEMRDADPAWVCDCCLVWYAKNDLGTARYQDGVEVCGGDYGPKFRRSSALVTPCLRGEGHPGRHIGRTVSWEEIKKALPSE